VIMIGSEATFKTGGRALTVRNNKSERGDCFEIAMSRLVGKISYATNGNHYAQVFDEPHFSNLDMRFNIYPNRTNAAIPISENVRFWINMGRKYISKGIPLCTGENESTYYKTTAVQIRGNTPAPMAYLIFWWYRMPLLYPKMVAATLKEYKKCKNFWIAFTVAYFKEFRMWDDRFNLFTGTEIYTPMDGMFGMKQSTLIDLLNKKYYNILNTAILLYIIHMSKAKQSLRPPALRDSLQREIKEEGDVSFEFNDAQVEVCRTLNLFACAVNDETIITEPIKVALQHALEGDIKKAVDVLMSLKKGVVNIPR
jgi:hypothetical protein